MIISAEKNTTSVRVAKLSFGLVALMISGCSELGRAYSGPDTVIATGKDSGTDDGLLIDGEAAIAYDPDGCQVWIIDDGLEGYSSPRFDPDTGLPICDGRYPPGTVIGNYETKSAPIIDLVPGHSRKVVVK